MRCIYCNSEEDLTSSDIISYAITGSKLTKKFVCYTHNAFTNDNYEKRFIADIDFFRNKLGLTTRNGKPIQYRADITVDGMTIHDIKVSNRKSLYSPKNVVAGTDNEGKKVLLAPMEKLQKIGKDKVTTVDTSNMTLHNTISANDLVGFFALHSVAKMAYEWYCYINNIEEYKKEYKEIVDYILGNNEKKIVDIVSDRNYYCAIDHLSEIGTNSFFQYDDANGFRYVVFNLWNTISYRVRICKSPSNIANISKGEIFHLYLYHLDGSKEKTAFGVISQGNSEKFRLITLQPNNINVDLWQPYVKRLENIMTTKVLSINYLKQVVDSIKTNLTLYDDKKIDIAQLLDFEEKNVLNVFDIINLLYDNREKYIKSKTFNENLALILNVNNDTITRTIEENKALASYLVELDKKGTLSMQLKNRIDNFYKIYNIEMERIKGD